MARRIPDQRPGGRPGTRALRALAMLAILAAAVAFTYRAVEDTGWPALTQRARSLPPGWLAAICTALALRFVAMERRWSVLLARLRPLPPLLHRLAMVMSGVFVNHVTPTLRLAGGLLRARYGSRPEGPDAATVYGSVLLDQAAHHLVTGVLTWAAFVAAAWLMGHRGVATAAAATLALLAGVAYGRRRRWLQPPATAPAAEPLPTPVTWLARLAAAGQRGLGSFRRLLSDRGVRLRLLSLTLAFVAGNVVAQWLVFAALGAAPPLAAVVATVLLGAAAGTLAGTPGGVGSTEAAMIAGYGALGLGRDEAVAATLIFRGLHYAAVIILGLPSVVYCELLRSRQGRVRSG